MLCNHFHSALDITGAIGQFAVAVHVAAAPEMGHGADVDGRDTPVAPHAIPLRGWKDGPLARRDVVQLLCAVLGTEEVIDVVDFE